MLITGHIMPLVINSLGGGDTCKYHILPVNSHTSDSHHILIVQGWKP